MSQSTLVVLLRGINVGRHKRLAMSRLRELLTGLGYSEVATHLQSGNAILSAGRKRPEAVAREIERQIEAELGMRVAVIVRTAAELAKVVSGNPFADRSDDPKKLMVTFLASAPTREQLAGVEPAHTAPDEFQVSGREVYLWLPNGLMRSRMGQDFWEKRLGITGTTRNWRTVTKLAELSNR